MSTRIPARNVTGDQVLRGTPVGGEDIQHFALHNTGGAELGTATNPLSIRRTVDTARSRIVLFSEALAGSTAESGLLSLAATRDFTAIAAATAFTVATGKTLRLVSYHLSARNTGTATAVGNVRVRLRAVASGGTLAATSPVQWVGTVGWPFAATATLEHSAHISGTFPEGMDFPAGAILGANLISSTANMTVGLILVGFEF